MHLMRHIVVAGAIVELSLATHVLFHSIIMHSTSVSNLNHRGPCSLRLDGKTIVMEDKPVLICCDGIACRKKVMLLVKEWAEEEDKDMVGGTVQMFACGKHLAARTEMLKCSRCKSIVYCSKACQKKHWKKGGHREECVPISES